MFTQKEIMFLYAESSVHIGGGESTGVIDKAIQRERYTGYPVGPASGIKGAVRDWFENLPYNGSKEPYKAHSEGKDKIRLTFGPENDNQNESHDHAGAAAFTDARILLFPVRSLSGVFAWITSPAVINRLVRDLTMADISTEGLQKVDFQKIEETKNIYGCTPEHACQHNNKVILEEYLFDYNSDLPGLEDLVKQLVTFLPQGNEYKYWRERLPNHFLLVNDDEFRDFVKHSTEVQARVKLGEKKTTTDGGNLFYEEFLPCDSLMYSMLFSQHAFDKSEDGWGRDHEIMSLLKTMNGNRLQFGADESIGKGIMNVHLLDNQ